MFFFFFSSRRRHTRCSRDWSSDVCSSDLALLISFIFDFGQYWMHRGMHNWYPLWLTHAPHHYRSEERRVGKSVDLGGRRIIKKKKNKTEIPLGDENYTE